MKGYDKMWKWIRSFLQAVIVFISCTIIFYFAIQSFHHQYESYVDDPFEHVKWLKTWHEKVRTIRLF